MSLKEALSQASGLSAMAPVPSPPGLTSSDPESATVSRERRRITLAVKVAIAEISREFSSRFDSIESKLDDLLDVVPNHGESRLARLETLMVCSPSADEVLEQMLTKHNRFQPDEELSPDRNSVSENDTSSVPEQIPRSPQSNVVQILDNVLQFDISSDAGGISYVATAESDDDGSTICDLTNNVQASCDLTAFPGVNFNGDWRAIPTEDWGHMHNKFSAYSRVLAKPVLNIEIDDWIVVDCRLASVVRFGYDKYAGQVRIVWPNERVDDWAAGQWRPRSSISPIVYPFRFAATRDFLSADEAPINIVCGMRGSLCTFDKDGDLVITLDDIPGTHYVFLADAVWLSIGENDSG